MYTTIGNVDGGELPGSVVAVDFTDVTPADFAEFICWTPHRYALSIEHNIVPQDLASEIRDELVNAIHGSVAHRLAEQMFDADYLQVVRGPREGHLVRLSQNPEIAADMSEDRDAISLIARNSTGARDGRSHIDR